MQDSEFRPSQKRQGRQSRFHFDGLLFVFLLLGWSLIFASATLALHRAGESWVGMDLVLDSSADYSPDPQNVKLAQVKPQIIEAIREDERVREQIEANPPATLGVLLPDVTPTATVSPTPSTTPSSGEFLVNAGGPYEGEEGSPIALAATGFNSVLNVLPRGVTYVWDLNGDGLYDDAEGISTEVTFFDEGDYPVAVQASDLLGRTAIDLTMISVENAPPVVELGEDLTTSEGQEISFLANVTDPGHDILFYEWDFGDTSPAMDGTLNPTHIYQQDGEFVVRLRVSDNDGGLTEGALTVYVANLPPLVNAGSSQTVNEGSPITFNGVATDPADDPDDLEYAWDFDYDGETFTPDEPGLTVVTVYPDGPANIIAALRVEDQDDGQTIDTVNVRVNNVAPVITRVSHDGPKGEGDDINFEVMATDVGADTLTYAFDWNNDGDFDTSDSSNIWYDEGDHTVQIRVDDGDGGQAFTTTVVSTYNLTPTAVAQVTGPSPIYEGSAVNFDGSESYDPGDDDLSYQWNFGDGSDLGAGENVTHTYADDGKYNVTLTVRDDSGASSSIVIPVTVLNKNPVINPISDRTVDEGVNTTFEGNVTDPGSADVASLSYEWDFDYDGTNFNTDTTGKSIIWTYPDGFNPTKTYVVALRVRDNDYPNPVGGGENGETIRTFNVTVRNVAPVIINFEDRYASDEGNEITLSTEPALDVPADPLIYEWDFSYGGDPSDFQVDAAGQTVTKVWQRAGEYKVALRVRDGDGGEALAIATAYINAPPQVYPGGPYAGIEGSPVTFDGSASFDPDNDPLTYRWTFGDGSPATNGISVTHTYVDNAVYTATLTLRDTDNSVNTGAVTVTIHNANPAADAGPDLTVNEGVPVSLTGNATDPGLADILSYAWDFDYNGNLADFNEDSIGPSASWPALDGPAVVTVALRVRDNDYPYATINGGEIGEDIDTLVVTVANVPPAATIIGPFEGVEDEPLTINASAIDVSADPLTYEWDLDNDGNFDDFEGSSATYTWETGGVYPIALKVTDDVTFTIVTAQIDINAKPINVDAGGPYNGDEGAEIIFNGIASDPEGDTLTYTWDFGDGAIATGQAVSHTYADNDDYIVTLAVDDGQGGITTDTTTAAVNNLPPTITAADAAPNPGLEGRLIDFTAAASEPGSVDILTYEWGFGDGDSDVGQSINHRYDDNNDYTVTLTVSDGDGGVDTTSFIVTILNDDPRNVDAGGPYLTTIGVPTPLTGSATDVPGDVPDLTYEWELNGDGNFDDANGPNPTYTWTAPGNYTVALRVRDGEGGETIATTDADVGSPPTADAGGSQSGDETVTTFTFNGGGSDDPDNDPLSYIWDFGDGNNATGANVSHTYADSGIYTVILTVNDGRGGIDSDSVTVTINNLPPNAEASASLNSTSEGTLITFDGSGSSDPGVNDTLNYAWDFGDGTTANTSIVDHTYADDGTYTVSLTVTDDEGASDTVSFDVTITNADPVAAINISQNPAPEGTLITFDGSGSSDPGSTDTLSYAWDLGDGTTANTPTIDHTYADDGTYTVSLTVTDDDGASDTITLDVTIINADPVAVINVSQNPVAEGASITFDSSGSTDPGSADTLSYAWDLGDGTTADTPTVDHTYADDGTYTVSLTVTDNQGASNTMSLDVTVTNNPPTNVTVSGPNSTTAGTPIDLTGSGSDIPADPLTYRWDLDGDGDFEDEGQTVTFSQDISGTYTVILEVSDDEGAATTTDWEITVNSILPFIWISLPVLLRRRNRETTGKIKKTGLNE